jgi:two-component system copper resistance phosphate regulon response regulator CusR
MRVLIIEDDGPLREALQQGLEEAGFAVDASADGEEGLWYARSNEYDVIVLDLMLPHIDGLTILGRLRRKGSAVPILILTARDTVADRVKGLDLGADDYLVKPFAFAELLARVRAMVRRGYNNKDPVIRVADLEIDTAGRTVRRGGRSVQLTAREYALLEFLAARAGQVVSRTAVWEHLYDFHSDPESNVVDVYVGHLRKKIEQPGRPKLIHTRRGQGYVLGQRD